MNNNAEQPIFIVDKKLKPYEIVLASMFYTVAIVTAFSYALILISYGVNMKTIAQLPKAIAISCLFFKAAVVTSEINQVIIDVNNKKLTHILKIVFYKKEKTVDVGYFDYVAMNNFTFGTTITLWFEGNKRMVLGTFYKKALAIRYAKALAKITKVDLLDKTSGTSVWTEYDKL